MEQSVDMQTTSVRKLCQFVLARTYNRQVPQICRWLIDQETDGRYRLKITRMDNNATQSSEIQETNLNFCCDLGLDMSPSTSSAPNITLILIICAIFIILFITAILTCTRRKQVQNDLDIENESVINMRIVSSLARLSRIHVVQLHNPEQMDPDPVQFQPPPDYETAEQIKKKEEEELPSYCQAISSTSSSCHM